MAGIECNCGYIIKSNMIPSPNDWIFMSEVEYDKYSGLVDSEELYMAMGRMVMCPNCERIWLYRDGIPVSYISEKSVNSER